MEIISCILISYSNARSFWWNGGASWLLMFLIVLSIDPRLSAESGGSSPKDVRRPEKGKVRRSSLDLPTMPYVCLLAGL